MSDAIVDHLKRHKLVLNTQHGFRKGRSCLSNLLAFLDKVTKCVDDGDSVDVVYLDFVTAFDKVPHQRLLQKLSNHGVDGHNLILQWIMNWLRDREQRVCLQGSASRWTNI